MTDAEAKKGLSGPMESCNPAVAELKNMTIIPDGCRPEGCVLILSAHRATRRPCKVDAVPEITRYARAIDLLQGWLFAVTWHQSRPDSSIEYY